MATTTKTLTHTVINSDVNINNDNKSDNNKNNKDTDYHNFKLGCGVPAQTIFKQCHMFTGQSRLILISQANLWKFTNNNVSEIFVATRRLVKFSH